MNAEISGGLYRLSRISTHAAPSSFFTTLYGRTLSAFCTSASSKRRPIRRLIAKTVLVGLVIACRLAIWPTSRSPDSVKATTEGVVRLPSELAITTGSPPSRMATQLLVVPRSMPITLAIVCLFLSQTGVKTPVRFVCFAQKHNQYLVIFNLTIARPRLARRRRQARDRYPCRPQQPVADVIAAHELVNHRIGLMLGGFDAIYRLMQQRIEGLAECTQLRDAMAAQEIDHRTQHHLDAFHDGLAVAAVARGSDRTFQVVDDRQQVAQQPFALNACAFLGLLTDAFAGVLRFRQRAQVFVLVFRGFLLFLFQRLLFLRKACQRFEKPLAHLRRRQLLKLGLRGGAGLNCALLGGGFDLARLLGHFTLHKPQDSPKR